MYSLCISIIDKDVGEIMFEADTRIVICVEGMRIEGLALAVVESENVVCL